MAAACGTSRQEVARRLGLLNEGGDNEVLDLDSHRRRKGK